MPASIRNRLTKSFARSCFFLLSFFIAASPAGAQEGKPEKATFAGGCFWCTESLYDKFPGVLSTTSGYTGGTVKDPSYEAVTSGNTGHAEAVEVLFDPAQVSYAELLERFWRNIDPTAKDRQFNDTGTQYRTAVFYHNEEQKRLALESKDKLEASKKFDRPIVTEILPAGNFYPAEDYHQDFHKKNPARYKMYNFMSGRDKFLKDVWGSEHQPAE